MSEAAFHAPVAIDQTQALLTELAELIQRLSGSATPPHLYVVSKTIRLARALLDRHPFRVGDVVRLTELPNITSTDKWGWLSSKHLFVPGALVRVRYLDYSTGAGTYTIGFTFLHETRTDRHGTVHTLQDDEKTVFPSLEVKYFERITSGERDTAVSPLKTGSSAQCAQDWEEFVSGVPFSD